MDCPYTNDNKKHRMEKQYNYQYVMVGKKLISCTVVGLDHTPFDIPLANASSSPHPEPRCRTRRTNHRIREPDNRHTNRTGSTARIRRSPRIARASPLPAFRLSRTRARTPSEREAGAPELPACTQCIVSYRSRS
jgi:hypothetical protein